MMKKKRLQGNKTKQCSKKGCPNPLIKLGQWCYVLASHRKSGERGRHHHDRKYYCKPCGDAMQY